MASTEQPLEFDSIEDSIKAFAAGNFIIVLDSPSRENEGDLIISASAMTPAKMSFLIRFSSGIICTPMPANLCDALALPQMLPPTRNADPNGTAYTVSIDAEHANTTTGVSAADRALTCTLLAADKPSAADFRRPGHVFPLRARDGGVLARQGHTEAAVDFARLSGRGSVGVIAELVEDGEEAQAQGGEVRAELVGGGMMRAAACVAFARRWGLKVCTIEALVEYRKRGEGAGEGMVNGV